MLLDKIQFRKIWCCEEDWEHICLPYMSLCRILFCKICLFVTKKSISINFL